MGVILITFTHIRHGFADGPAYFLLEILPPYGTLVLSVISGYLFACHPLGKEILGVKIRTLLIPYLVANLAVILPVLALHMTGYDYLNRLPYDTTLISEGLFALHSPPVNPPTYFVRDLFALFCCIALFKRNWYALLVIVPLLVFGNLLLRYDIAVMFALGFALRKLSATGNQKWIITAVVLLTGICFYLSPEWNHCTRHCIAFLIFLWIVDLKIEFPNTGGYTYCLHLYHTPVMIFLFPILHALWPNPYFEAASQIVLAALFSMLILLAIRKLGLNWIVGNR